jgi:phosphohistidine phosphatase
MSELALALAGTGAPGLLERVRAKFPTAAIAVLTFSGGWSGLAVGRARLARFVTPRDIRAASGAGRPG